MNIPDRLVVEGVRVDIAAGAARLVNLSVSVGLTMYLRWEVSVSVPALDSWDGAGSIDFGTISTVVPLPDVQIPGLRSIPVDPAARGVPCAGGRVGTDVVVPLSTAPDIASPGLDVQAHGDLTSLVSDAGVLKLTLDVTPSIGLHADELRLTDVRAGGTTGSVRVPDTCRQD
jgi:hypothetical protein